MTEQRVLVVAALDQVVDETRLLFHRLRKTAEAIHRQGEFTAGRRGILRSLHLLGPQTVPQLARARPVSRQHIQMLVNPLLREGYLERVENPAHKRSKLVRLTAEGRAMAEEMHRREAAFFEAIAAELSVDELEAAAKALKHLREFLTKPEIQNLAERTGR